jgi:nucleoid-associated protein YgaU
MKIYRWSSGVAIFTMLLTFSGCTGADSAPGVGMEEAVNEEDNLLSNLDNDDQQNADLDQNMQQEGNEQGNNADNEQGNNADNEQGNNADNEQYNNEDNQNNNADDQDMFQDNDGNNNNDNEQFQNNQQQEDQTNDYSAEPEASIVSRGVSADFSAFSEGYMLRGDAGEAAGPGLPELGSKIPYVIQKGDTLSKVAEKVYGNRSKWKLIAGLTGVANPNMIFPGDVVYYQLDEASLRFAKTEVTIDTKIVKITVQPGDSLSLIAQKVLGKTTEWQKIWKMNSHIQNPDQIEVGMSLTIEHNILNTVAIKAVKELNNYTKKAS